MAERKPHVWAVLRLPEDAPVAAYASAARHRLAAEWKRSGDAGEPVETVHDMGVTVDTFERVIHVVWESA